MSSPSKQLFWIPDDEEMWALASQCSPQFPNGTINFLILKTQKMVAIASTKCIPAVEMSVYPEDLAMLQDVNPASILATTRERFQRQKIYTNIGSVLLSVNPFNYIFFISNICR